MMKILLIVSILLISSVNANMFQALKDAAVKAVEAQKNLNSSSNQDNTEASSDQSSPPQFNSLAEEAAYKKKQTILAEQQKVAEEKQYVSKEKSRAERFKAKENAILEKYFIKRTDSLEMIENKFKNRVRLFSEMPKDYRGLGQLSEYGENMSGLFNVIITVPEETYINLAGYSGTSRYFSGLEECRDDNDCIQEAFKAYEQYIKKSYETYDSRQVEMKHEKEEKARMLQAQKEYNAKADQAQKEQKNKALKIQEERQKVQGACQAWRAKANKGVYSLGVGDKISCGDSLVFVIQAVNANTFTVLLPYYNQYIYKEKSMCVPAASLSSAPSPYCYR